jgi:phosphoglycerate kinase
MPMKLATLSRIKNLQGKRVLLRVDFNVPIDARGRIGADADARIRAALATIEVLRKGKAKTIVVSHLGRPEGREMKYTLAPVAKHLAKLIDSRVLFVGDDIEDDSKVERHLARLKDGEVAVLENIRFYKGEEKNNVFLARRLASFADLFVDDAFAVAHRAHASNVGVTKFLPSYAGVLMEREVKHLSHVLEKPKRPFVVLMGGAKVSSKLPTIEKLQKIADLLLIGGGMANAFFRAKGLKVGKSDVSPADVKLAKRFLSKKNIRIPEDVLVATRLDDKANPQVRLPKDVRPDEQIVDAGTETVRKWAGIIKNAKTIVWNGPIGLFEVKKFSHGSVALGRVIAARSSGKAFGVVGGGETVQCLERTGMAEFVDHVSTGGGAMLEFLAGKKLPGVEALMKK